MYLELRSHPQWTSGDIHIKYELGDLCIFDKVMKGIVCTSHFLDLSEDLLAAPSGFLDRYKVQAALVMSCPVGKRVKNVAMHGTVIVYCMALYQHHFVDTERTFSDYLAKFKSKTRATLKKKVNKLLDNDGASGSFVKFEKPHEIEKFLHLSSEISVKTYQHRLYNRGMPNGEKFKTDAVQQAAKRLVRGYILYLHGTAIAYTFVPAVKEGTFLYDYNGYDPEFSKLSPGTVMQYKIIEDLCSDPCASIYDLCTGEDEAKDLFSTHSVYCGDFLILERSIKNFGIVFFHMTIKYLSKFTGRILSYLKFKSYIKGFIRRVA